MKIVKEDLIRVNRGFEGQPRNESSLDFALQQQENKRLGGYRKLAYIWRAILVDRAFSDGNKRTAMFVAFAFAEEHNKIADRELLIHHTQSVASKNITDLRQIERRLKNAIR